MDASDRARDALRVSISRHLGGIDEATDEILDATLASAVRECEASTTDGSFCALGPLQKLANAGFVAGCVVLAPDGDVLPRAFVPCVTELMVYLEAATGAGAVVPRRIVADPAKARLPLTDDPWLERYLAKRGGEYPSPSQFLAEISGATGERQTTGARISVRRAPRPAGSRPS